MALLASYRSRCALPMIQDSLNLLRLHVLLANNCSLCTNPIACWATTAWSPGEILSTNLVCSMVCQVSFWRCWLRLPAWNLPGTACFCYREGGSYDQVQTFHRSRIKNPF